MCEVNYYKLAHMTDFKIREINVDSDDDMRMLNELDEACDLETYGAISPMTVQERRAMFAPSNYKKSQHFVAEVAEDSGARIVGVGVCGMPLNENKETAYVGLAVHPQYRGRGIGSALADQLVRAARKNERTRLSGWGSTTVDADAHDPSLPWNRLAARMGMQKKNIAHQKTLNLPIDSKVLQELDAKVAEKIGDYRIDLWPDGIPEDQLENYGLLMRQLDLDEPTGEHQLEAPEYPADRVREIYEKQKAMGYQNIIAVAFSPEDEIAGQSEIAIKTTPGTSMGYQENTLVMPGHRGHALGLAMKLANHRQLAEVAPHIEVLITGNSLLNTQMNAINEQLGYEAAVQELAYQGDVA